MNVVLTHRKTSCRLKVSEINDQMLNLYQAETAFDYNAWTNLALPEPTQLFGISLPELNYQLTQPHFSMMTCT